jgi:hypothetical protein
LPFVSFVNQALVAHRAAPFAEQDRGVVCEPAVMVIDNSVHQPAKSFRYGQAVGVLADDEVNEAIQPEYSAFGIAGFGDAVRVQQQPVARL